MAGQIVTPFSFQVKLKLLRNSEFGSALRAGVVKKECSGEVHFFKPGVAAMLITPFLP
jgi:hypothetical protein